MSPHARGLDAGLPRFPRVSGDEPDQATAVADAWAFSPRERG